LAGPEGQQAFDDLAALYASGKPVPGLDQALKDLADNLPPARETAGRYLLALLKQSLADETNGRAKWRALSRWGGGAESASRDFRKQLAEIIANAPPALDRASDARWIAAAARDLLAKLYQQQMLDAFTRDRDYPAVIRIARHLAKPQFQGWRYFDQTQKLAAQLEKRGDDFKTLVLPTPDEWKDIRSKLARPAQMEYLAARMRLLNAFQWGQPGDVDFEDAQTREASSASQARHGKRAGTQTINPLVELRGWKFRTSRRR
jgi:hypothetical protein